MSSTPHEAPRRRTSPRLATSPGCKPLFDMYQAVEGKPTIKSWTQVEERFLLAMEGFDTNVADGTADQGDWQNGKGDFFNDLISLLLERASGVALWSRKGVPGLIFPQHSLDVTYPPDGIAEFLVEAKAVGNPRHAANTKQPNPLGRPGAADLDKRVKEAAFKTIDLKAEYGRLAVQRGEQVEAISGDLTAWLRRVKPTSYLFIAARVVSDLDRQKVESYAQKAAQVFDGVGAFCFAPVSNTAPTTYAKAPVRDPAVDLERVLHRAALELASRAKALGAAGPS